MGARDPSGRPPALAWLTALPPRRRSLRLCRRHAGEPVMAQLARGVAVEDPIAVFSACQRPGMREFPERRRDSRPVGADEICEPLVGERERNYNAVRMHSPPALGEVPKDQHEPVVDALVRSLASSPPSQWASRSGINAIRSASPRRSSTRSWKTVLIGMCWMPVMP